MSNVNAVKVSGTWRSLAGIYANVSGVWKLVTAYQKDSGTWRQTYETLSLSMSDTTISATGTSPATVTTAAVTGTASGGYYDEAYTYAWSYLSGSVAIEPASYTSASTTFSRSSGTGLATTKFRLTVTDSYGNTANSGFVDLTVNITRNAP